MRVQKQFYVIMKFLFLAFGARNVFNGVQIFVNLYSPRPFHKLNLLCECSTKNCLDSTSF